jgi:hypothetical protein
MKRGFSPATTAAFATTMLVLAIVGWSIGWLAGGNATPVGQQSPDRTSSPAASASTPKSPTGTPTRTAGPTTTAGPTRADAFPMPDLVNKPFRAARTQALNLKLGVEVKFSEPNPSKKADGTVLRTQAEAKDFVWPGLTIYLYVAGPAPLEIVPYETGKDCGAAKDHLVAELGFKIDSYPSGNNGKVYKTDPAGASPAAWGTAIKLYCSESGAAPSVSTG